MDEIELKKYYQRVANLGLYMVRLSLDHGSKPWGYGSSWTWETLETDSSRSPGYDLDPRSRGLNIDGALLLGYSYSRLSFYTPLGAFVPAECFLDQGEEQIMTRLKERFGCEVIIPKRNDRDWGEIGPYYSMARDLEGRPFSSLALPLSFKELKFDETRELWERVKPDLLVAKNAAIAALEQEGLGGVAF